MNLLQALQIMLASFKFCGVLPFDWQTSDSQNCIIRLSKFWYRYSILLVGFLLLLITYSIPHWFSRFIHGYNATDFTAVIIIIIFVITGATHLHFIIYNQEKQIEILKNLTIISSKILEPKCFRALNIKINVLSIIFTILLIYTALFEPLVWPTEDSTLINLLGFISIRIVIICLEQQFFIFCLVLKILLQHLNNILLNLFHNQGVEVSANMIFEIRNLYVSMWELAEMMNSAFEPLLLMWFMCHCSDLLTTAFFLLISLIYQNVIEYNTTTVKFGLLTWTPYLICRNFALCWIGDKIKGEVRRLSCVLHKIAAFTTNRSLLNEVQIFTDLLQHQKIEFQVFAVFKLDKNLLYNIYGSIASYLIILMQFHNSSIKEDLT